MSMRITGAERAITILGYLPLLSAILLLVRVRRDSMFVQFHVRQSWVLFLLGLAITIIVGILLIVLPVAVVQTALFMLLFLAWLLYASFMIVGMIKAGLGERYRMPVVADVALIMRL